MVVLHIASMLYFFTGKVHVKELIIWCDQPMKNATSD